MRGKAPGRPRSKYGAIQTVIDGIRFDSKAEAARWIELQMMAKMGAIESLERQVRCPLFVGETRIGVYVADFTYTTVTTPPVAVVEDVKGMKTPLYRWKKKHFEAQTGRIITEITAKRQRKAKKR